MLRWLRATIIDNTRTVKIARTTKHEEEKRAQGGSPPLMIVNVDHALEEELKLANTQVSQTQSNPN